MKFEHIWITLFNTLKMKFGGKYIGLKYRVLTSFFIDHEYNLSPKCCFIGILILINKGKSFILINASALNTGRKLDVNNDLDVNKHLLWILPITNLTLIFNFVILSICNKDALILGPVWTIKSNLISSQWYHWSLELERENFKLRNINLRTVFNVCRCIKQA